ncbi:hypothetical protein EHS25_009517 [Saitozyma podzolica]|uniref:RNA helicase n=1 Tax=Saitozyma podzolica TaxID=1890683 RepID=A0A427YJF4_9TREE|nr:hypothetical protein EHS25_009517 [Saitozyma podzolica]
MPPMQFWKPGAAAPGGSTSRFLLVITPPAYPLLTLLRQFPRSRDRVRGFAPPFLLGPCAPIIGRAETEITDLQAPGEAAVSTQIPQYLHEAGWTAQNHVVACTQPRRVAATSVATRVAEEVGSVLGDEVGYSIRFEDLSSPTRTRIKYMTDGMLFRETMVDPLLSRYSVIMIDEAHERGAYTDLLLGLVKKIMKRRPELRVIISSATIDAEDFLEYFNSNADGTDRSKDDAMIVSLEGRMYPVEVCYLKEPCVDYCEAAVQTVFDMHLKEPPGDVLVFLTGREEIDQVIQQVADRLQSLPKAAPKILALPLYATLPVEEQAIIFDPPPRDTRKVIFSTNIAEASVTIDGIKYVVDSGFVKASGPSPS